MATVTWIDCQEAVRALESRLIKSLTLARLAGAAVTTQDGRFRVKRMLGRGASGVVCAAEDSKMQREVALKLYPGLPDDQLAAGVRAEARALGRLRHTNVVTVHDIDASVLRPGEIWCFYMSMELLRGPSLRRWLAEGPGTSRAIEMLCRAGDGLVAAHAAGLVHRDLKPENVMLDGDIPKLVDFGLARDMVVTTGIAAVDPHQRAIVGTLAYMAPEALEGRADARSDVFSFAAAVWEACYGEFPYPIDTLDPAAHRRITPPRRRRELPEELIGCLSRALRGEPRERTGSMAELLRELRSLVPAVEAMAAPSASAGPTAAATASDMGRPATASTGASAPRSGALAAAFAWLLAGAGVAAGGLWAAGFWETGAEGAEQDDAEVAGSAAEQATSAVAVSPGVAVSAAAPTSTSAGGDLAGTARPAATEPKSSSAPRAEQSRCPTEEAFAGKWSFATASGCSPATNTWSSSGPPPRRSSADGSRSPSSSHCRSYATSSPKRYAKRRPPRSRRPAPPRTS